MLSTYYVNNASGRRRRRWEPRRIDCLTMAYAPIRRRPRNRGPGGIDIGAFEFVLAGDVNDDQMVTADDYGVVGQFQNSQKKKLGKQRNQLF